jgi:hypothetical protein
MFMLHRLIHGAATPTNYIYCPLISVNKHTESRSPRNFEISLGSALFDWVVFLLNELLLAHLRGFRPKVKKNFPKGVDRKREGVYACKAPKNETHRTKTRKR